MTVTRTQAIKNTDLLSHIIDAEQALENVDEQYANAQLTLFQKPNPTEKWNLRRDRTAQLLEAEIKRLNAQIAITQTAVSAYKQALKRELSDTAKH